MRQADNYRDAIKQFFSVLFVVHEHLNVVIHTSPHLHELMISDGVFAEKVKFHYKFLAIVRFV